MPSMKTNVLSGDKCLDKLSEKLNSSGILRRVTGLLIGAQCVHFAFGAKKPGCDGDKLKLQAVADYLGL